MRKNRFFSFPQKSNILFASVLKLGIVSALAVLCEGYGQFKSERELKQDCIGQFVFLNYAIKFAGPGEWTRPHGGGGLFEGRGTARRCGVGGGRWEWEGGGGGWVCDLEWRRPRPSLGTLWVTLLWHSLGIQQQPLTHIPHPTHSFLVVCACACVRASIPSTTLCPLIIRAASRIWLMAELARESKVNQGPKAFREKVVRDMQRCIEM